jgi:hypothetical protein
MSDHDRLADALRGRADSLGDQQPLTLDDVKGRASGIRRRRRAVAGLAAAAVLAVAVPAGIALTDRSSDTVRPDRAPVATDPGPSTPLDLAPNADSDGEPPQVPYVHDGAIHLPDGGEVPVDRDYDRVAGLGDGWAVSDFGEARVWFLGPDGQVLGSDESTGYLAAATDGTIVAYATPEGRIMTVTEDAEPLPLGDAAVTGQTIAPVAVRGSGTCDLDVSAGCVVHYNDLGETQAAYHATSKGINSVREGVVRLSAMAADGSVSAVVSVDDLEPGSCSVVLDPLGEEVHRSCEHTFGAFSPDGRRLLAGPAYQDGLGDRVLAILDAATGEVAVEWRAPDDDTWVGDAVWETEDTVLATLWHEGSWSLVRAGVDGTLATVVGDLGGEAEGAPLHLAVRP